MGAELYSGHRKRAPEQANDMDRMERLKQPPSPPPLAPTASVPDLEPVSGAAEPKPKRRRWDEGVPEPQGERSGVRPASPARPDNILKQGGYVKLRGLKGAVERNGQVGVIQKYDEGTGRYTVLLRDTTMLRVRPTNLLQMLDVRVIGLEGKIPRLTLPRLRP